MVVPIHIAIISVPYGVDNFAENNGVLKKKNYETYRRSARVQVALF